MLISSPLQSFTGGQGQIVSLRADQRHFSLTVRQGGRVPCDLLLCMLTAIDSYYNNKSNKKRRLK